MLKRNKELEFSKDDLKKLDNGEFWFEEDLLDRGKHVKALTNLLAPTEGNFVLTLEFPMGHG